MFKLDLTLQMSILDLMMLPFSFNHFHIASFLFVVGCDVDSPGLLVDTTMQDCTFPLSSTSKLLVLSRRRVISAGGDADIRVEELDVICPAADWQESKTNSRSDISLIRSESTSLASSSVVLTARSVFPTIAANWTTAMILAATERGSAMELLNPVNRKQKKHVNPVDACKLPLKYNYLPATGNLDFDKSY